MSLKEQNKYSSDARRSSLAALLSFHFYVCRQQMLSGSARFRAGALYVSSVMYLI